MVEPYAKRTGDDVAKEQSDLSSTLRDELLRDMVSPCKFTESLEAMPSELAEQVVDVLRDRRFSTASLVRKLASRGYKVDRHRVNECRRECNCPFNLTGEQKGDA